MQAFPNTWDNVLKDLFSGYMISSANNEAKIETGIIELNTRVNFKFNLKKYLLTKRTNQSIIKIVRTDRETAALMKGSVVPLNFWDSADAFYKNGIGFGLCYDNQLVSMAFSSFILDNQLELGIETIEQYKGKGLALLACSALIGYCVENGYEPVWACRLENMGSYKLALKLGFEPMLSILYYRLSN